MEASPRWSVRLAGTAASGFSELWGGLALAGRGAVCPTLVSPEPGGRLFLNAFRSLNQAGLAKAS